MKSIEINEELLAEVLGIQDIVHVQEEGSCSIFISRANNPAYIKGTKWKLIKNN